MKATLFHPIVEDHIETAGHGDDELMKIAMSMGPTVCPPGYVIEVINPFNFEWHVPVAFNESQISPRIMNFWEFEQFAVLYGHGV